MGGAQTSVPAPPRTSLAGVDEAAHLLYYASRERLLRRGISMTDDGLRRLGRTRGLEGELAQGEYIAALLRAGELERNSVRLAAALGHPGACAAEPDQVPFGVGPAETLVSPLAEADHEVYVLGAVRLSEAALDTWQARFDDSRPAEILVAVRQWLEDPTPANRVAVEATREAAFPLSFDVFDLVEGEEQSAETFQAALAALDVVLRTAQLVGSTSSWQSIQPLRALLASAFSALGVRADNHQNHVTVRPSSGAHRTLMILSEALLPLLLPQVC